MRWTQSAPRRKCWNLTSKGASASTMLDFANLKGSVVLKGGFRMATIWPEEAVAEGTEERMAKLGAAMAKLKF